MNIHISNDEKFLDGFIRNARECDSPENVYIVISETQPLRHVAHPEVIICSSGLDQLASVLNGYQEIRNIYFHSMDNFFSDAIEGLELHKKYTLILLFYGAEAFLLEQYQDSFYLPETDAIRKEVLDVYFRFSWSPMQLRRNYINHRFYYKKQQTMRTKVMRALQRMHYIGHYIQEDFDKYLKPLNPGAQLIHWNFFGAAQDAVDNFESTRDQQIVLGNSGSDFNNHSDALSFLKKADCDLDIVTPLSYGGQTSYVEAVIKKGKMLFGERFKPLTDFMTSKAYYDLVGRSQAAVYFNVRSQAAGNILWFLVHRIPVFMHPESTLYRFFRTKDIHVFSALDDFPVFLKQGLQESDLEKLARNADMIEQEFGSNAMQKKYTRLLNI